MRVPALTLVPLALAGCGHSPPDPRGVDRSETFLTVSASGRADTRPDEARLQLGVQSLGASANEASRANREKMGKVTQALSQLGVKPEDLQTRNLTLQRIDYGPDRGKFRADNMIELKLRDMAKVGEAVAAVTDAGANILSGPELRVSAREGASRSAYAAAYKAAKARAEAYAGAADLKISRVLGIYDGGESYAPPPYVREMSVQASAPPAPPPPPVAPAPFNPGINSTEVRVRVDFALAPK
jgi:hypothetical protein